MEIKDDNFVPKTAFQLDRRQFLRLAGLNLAKTALGLGLAVEPVFAGCQRPDTASQSTSQQPSVERRNNGVIKTTYPGGQVEMYTPMRFSNKTAIDVVSLIKFPKGDRVAITGEQNLQISEGFLAGFKRGSVWEMVVFADNNFRNLVAFGFNDDGGLQIRSYIGFRDQPPKNSNPREINIPDPHLEQTHVYDFLWDNWDITQVSWDHIKQPILAP